VKLPCLFSVTASVIGMAFEAPASSGYCTSVQAIGHEDIRAL